MSPFTTWSAVALILAIGAAVGVFLYDLDRYRRDHDE